MLLLFEHLKDKEACPCGSGLPFGDCCKFREPAISNSRKPPEVQAMEMLRKGLKSCCMYPDTQNCKGKIKKAHALQNNKIISLLAGESRHVYVLGTKETPTFAEIKRGHVEPLVYMKRTSANDATTETCFCDLHDNVAFAAIEKGAPDFDAHSEEMKFTYAYKAFIFEYYKHWCSLDMFRRCFRLNPAAYQNPLCVAEYRQNILKLSEFDTVKHFFDGKILSGAHNGVYTQVINLQKQIKFACYAYIAPNYDLNGKRIRHTRNGCMHRLAITAFPEEHQSWILFSCLESEKKYYSSFFEQLSSSPLAKVEWYLSVILSLYTENMVLSPDLWEDWDEITQSSYLHLANLRGKDFAILEKAISINLKNMMRSKCKYSPCKIDLFR